VFLGVLLAVASGPVFAAESVQDVTILVLGSYWRQHETRIPPVVSVESARTAGLAHDEASRSFKPNARDRGFIGGESPPPPREWIEMDFDDSAWVRARAFHAGRHSIGLGCRRGKFLVRDPAGVKKLTLELAYAGGLVVYLNGSEVARTSLSADDVTPRTPADDYPSDAFFVSDGPRNGKLLHHYTDRERKEQFALRTRTAGPIELPTARLRRGVNVLAIEIHRSGYPALCRKLGLGEFAPLGLSRLSLRAEANDGAVVPAVVRPEGLHVWNAEVTEEVTELDYGHPCEPLRPVRILALRNSTFSGQVVVSSTRELAAVEAKLGSLACDRASIPAAAVKMRYGRPGQIMRYWGGYVYGGPRGVSLGVNFQRFDGLVDDPPTSVVPTSSTDRLKAEIRQALGLPETPAPAATMPIWVTVSVPADAAAGAYRGDLTIRARGEQDVVVPVELEVFDWTLPEVKDYASEFSVYQSPDTLAAYYNVPLWSDAHWRLVEQSVRLIGEAGNHTIIIPLLSKEQGGNEQSYVYRVRQSDGSFQYDTRVMDRYLDLYTKHHHPDRIKAVCFIVWGNAGVARGNPWQQDKYDHRGVPTETRGAFTVTMLDPKTGTKSDMPLPPIGSEAYEAFWRPILLEVKANLEKRGLADRMMLGMPADPHPAKPALAAFQRILPEAGWFVGNHPGATRYGYDRDKYVRAVHVERVYTGPLPDPATKRQFGWQREQMALAFNRYGFGPLCLYPNPCVWAFRIMMEVDLASGHRGAGRIGADYWKMDTKSGSGGAGTFYLRYPHSSIGQTGMASNCAALLAPGPKGPVTSARFENVREGIQNAEAVIFVQKALLAEKITAALAKKTWQILDERVEAMRTYTLGVGHGGWQQRDQKLYELVAEVARQLRAAN